MSIPLVLDDSSEGCKESSARAISMMATVLEADFIFQVRGAWMLTQRHVARHEEILEKYGSIAVSPYARDVAVFSLETTHGTWVATDSIKSKPPSEKRRTFAAVTFDHIPGVQGRFVGLRPGKKNEGGAFH